MAPASILKKPGQSTVTPKKVSFKRHLAFDIITGVHIPPREQTKR
jgi:hypothetical protein